MNGADLLTVDALAVDHVNGDARVRALDGASIRIAGGEILGVVGESGSGKSTLAAAIGRLLPPTAEIAGGHITIDGVDIHRLAPPELRRLRRDILGFVFQSPISSFDPTRRIRRQIRDALDGRSVDVPMMLASVGLDQHPSLLTSYPHQLSGGMAQRLAIALTLARHPRLLVADEPTAALDATVQAGVMSLLVERCRASNTALAIFTHDLDLVADHCDRVVVMYGGRDVETGLPAALFSQPRHPYTRALIDAAPSRAERGTQLAGIPGAPPVLHGRLDACAFAARCPYADDTCHSRRPETVDTGSAGVACHHPLERAAT